MEELDRKFITLAEKFLEKVKELHRKYGEVCSIKIIVRSNDLGGKNGIDN
ncbi:MAG: hypothetical protein AABX78_03330 [Nanoarchaeota archaeon]